jgi:HprK-related kinase B
MGIAKQPRINPGTIVNNPRLQKLIPKQRREELLALPQQELWDLEEKYDVIIEDMYGCGRIVQQAPMEAFVVLNWQRDSEQALSLERVDLDERRDLLRAITKSPGPFCQYADGSFIRNKTPIDEQPYIDTLKHIDVFEASGRVDFAALSQRLGEIIS